MAQNIIYITCHVKYPWRVFIRLMKSTIYKTIHIYLCETEQTERKKVVLCLHYNWERFSIDSVLTVGRRPSSTAVGTPAIVTTPVDWSTGPPTRQCACKPRSMPMTHGGLSLATNQTTATAFVAIATPLTINQTIPSAPGSVTHPCGPITWQEDHFHKPAWNWG